MEIRSIKNVDDETWRRFKALAVAKGVGMAILLKNMVDNFEKSEKENSWDFILKGEKLLSESEATEFSKVSSELRKEKGFRI